MQIQVLGEETLVPLYCCVAVALLSHFACSLASAAHEPLQRRIGVWTSLCAALRHFELLRRMMVIRYFEVDGSFECYLYEKAMRSERMIAIRACVLESRIQEKAGSSSASARSVDVRKHSVEA